MIASSFLLHAARMTGAVQVDAHNGLSFPNSRRLDVQHVKLLMAAEFGFELSDEAATDLLTYARLQGAREALEAAERGFVAHEAAGAPMGYLSPARWRRGRVGEILHDLGLPQ